MKSYSQKVLFVLLFLSFLAGARAQSVPPLVNYQGRLASPDGAPLPTGDYELSVQIWDAATNGTRVWGPQIFGGIAAPGHGPKIPVVQGYFNLMLGPAHTNGLPLSGAFAAANRFVEVTVSNRSPILPRQPILTTPYAFRAGDLADGIVSLSKLAARDIGSSVGVGGIAVSGNIPIASTSQDAALPGATVTLASTGRPVLVQGNKQLLPSLAGSG